MLIIIVCVALVAQTYSFQEHCCNKVVRRKTEYRVNITIPDNDIEMVDLNNLIQFNDTGQTSSLPSRAHMNKLPSTARIATLVTQYNRTMMYPKIFKPTQNKSPHELVKSRNHPHNSLTKSNYADKKSEDNQNNTHYIGEIDAQKRDLEEHKSPARIARDISADRIWSIVQIWLIVYFVLAIPLWCTIGRCCCCLVCKCFRAQETIREAKQYAMWNPPGVLRKKTGDVIYTPSEKEKEAYEELEHLIRTL